MHKYLLTLIVFVLPVLVSAHVSVKPSEVGIGAYQTFNVSVPTEKDIATIGVRLVIPEGLQSVRPNVKQGWNIEIIKEGEGDDAPIKELIWTGGSIPADQRDDFFFSAKTPAGETTLRWDAYQTYSDGSVIAWSTDEASQPKDASGEDDFSAQGPYSETKVINDLKKEEAPVVLAPIEEERDKFNGGRGCWGVTSGAAAIALILSAYAVYAARRPKTTPTLPQ